MLGDGSGDEGSELCSTKDGSRNQRHQQSDGERLAEREGDVDERVRVELLERFDLPHRLVDLFLRRPGRLQFLDLFVEDVMILAAACCQVVTL